MSGGKIFEIMFFGTKFTDNDQKTQKEITYTLKENFNEISEKFTKVLTDIANISNNSKNKT